MSEETTWDNVARQVLDSEGELLREYNLQEHKAADQALTDSARLNDLDARITRIEAHLWLADPEPEPGQPVTAPAWEDYGGVWPDQTLLADDGKIWRNVAGVPLTTRPSEFPGDPGQWTRLFVEVKAEPDEPSEPDEWPAWEPWDHVRPLYQIEARVTHNGRRWIATVGNNHWEPGVYGWNPVTD